MRLSNRAVCFYFSFVFLVIVIMPLHVHALFAGVGQSKDMTKTCLQKTKTIQDRLTKEALKKNVYTPGLKKKIESVKYLPVYEVPAPGGKASVSGTCDRKPMGDTDLKKKGEQRGECKESLVVFKGNSGERDRNLCDAKVVKISDGDGGGPGPYDTMDEYLRAFQSRNGIDEEGAAAYSSYLKDNGRESQGWPTSDDEKIPSPYNEREWRDFRYKNADPQSGDVQVESTDPKQNDDRSRYLCEYERTFGYATGSPGPQSVRIFRRCKATS